MKVTKSLMLLFFGFFILASCGKDSDDSPDPDPEPEPEECPLSAVLWRFDSSTSTGLFNVLYDDDGVITKLGLTFDQFEMFYNADGSLKEAIRDEDIGPYVYYQFTYAADGKLASFTETWGEAPDDELRYTYTPTYNGNFITQLTQVGLQTREFDYEFDSNGNPLKWTSATFGDYTFYTFDTSKKGLVEGLSHELAFAYGTMIRRPHLHMSHAMTSEMNFNASDELEDESTYTDNVYSEAGFLMEVNDPNGRSYIFNYDCE